MKNIVNHPDVNIKYIENIKAQNIYCGKNVLSLLDNSGKIFLFNEADGLVILRTQAAIKSVKFAGNNIFALTEDNKALYEFSSKLFSSGASLNNYYESKYFFAEDYISQIQLLEMPYFTNTVFFYAVSNKNLDNKTKLIKGEGALYSNMDNDRRNLESFCNNTNTTLVNNISRNNNSHLNKNTTNLEDRNFSTMNNNFINNINININNTVENSEYYQNKNHANNNLEIVRQMKSKLGISEGHKLENPVFNINQQQFLNENNSNSNILFKEGNSITLLIL